jgi:hypothetical protein
MTLSRRGAGCNRHICLSKSSQSCRSMSHPSDTASRLSELRAIVYRSIIPAGRKTHERVNWSLRLTTRAFSVVARWFLKKGPTHFLRTPAFAYFFAALPPRARPSLPAGPAASRASRPSLTNNDRRFGWLHHPGGSATVTTDVLARFATLKHHDAHFCFLLRRSYSSEGSDCDTDLRGQRIEENSQSKRGNRFKSSCMLKLLYLPPAKVAPQQKDAALCCGALRLPSQQKSSVEIYVCAIT